MYKIPEYFGVHVYAIPSIQPSTTQSGPVNLTTPELFERKTVINDIYAGTNLVVNPV